MRAAYAFLFAALIGAASCQDESAIRSYEEQRRAKAAADAIIGGEKKESGGPITVAAHDWLADARGRDGVERHRSGIITEIVIPAAADAPPRPPAGSSVNVHYEGRLQNGAVFDSSFARGEPISFPMDNVVPGFREALSLMRPGEEMIVYMPAALGYGADGAPPDIPPNAPLQFRIRMISYTTPDGQLFAAPGR